MHIIIIYSLCFIHCEVGNQEFCMYAIGSNVQKHAKHFTIFSVNIQVCGKANKMFLNITPKRKTTRSSVYKIHKLCFALDQYDLFSLPLSLQ